MRHGRCRVPSSGGRRSTCSLQEDALAGDRSVVFMIQRFVLMPGAGRAGRRPGPGWLKAIPMRPAIPRGPTRPRLLCSSSFAVCRSGVSRKMSPPCGIQKFPVGASRMGRCPAPAGSLSCRPHSLPLVLGRYEHYPLTVWHHLGCGPRSRAARSLVFRHERLAVRAVRVHAPDADWFSSTYASDPFLFNTGRRPMAPQLYLQQEWR